MNLKPSSKATLSLIFATYLTPLSIAVSENSQVNGFVEGVRNFILELPKCTDQNPPSNAKTSLSELPLCLLENPRAQKEKSNKIENSAKTIDLDLGVARREIGKAIKHCESLLGDPEKGISFIEICPPESDEKSQMHMQEYHDVEFE